MKKTIAVSVVAVSLLIAGPGQPVSAQPVSAQRGDRANSQPAVNSMATLVLRNAANLNVLPSSKPKLLSGQIIAQKAGTPVHTAPKQPVSRGDSGRFDARKVIRIALSLKGTPYKWSGQTPKGFDCSGFTRYVFMAAAGIELPRSSAEQAEKGTTVARADLEPGDLVFFRTSGKGISHVGIYIGGDNFISATNSNGVAVSGLNDEYWGSRYAGARRINQ